MYRLIVASKVKSTWRRVNGGDLGAPVALASDDVEFTFVGTTELSANLSGRDAFGEWFAQANKRLPGLQFELLDVAVKGWPWNTRVATRLRVTSDQLGPERYVNEMSQWITLRWGKMTHDWVLEDTATLNTVLASTATVSGSAVGQSLNEA